MSKFFHDIPGQERVKKILSNFTSISNIPHALLFSGMEGTGKEFFAIRYAQLINSNISSGVENEKILNQIKNISEPYVKYIIPLPRGRNETDNDGSTDKLSTEEIELLHEQLNKKINNPYYNFTLPKANTIKINSIREIKKFLSLDFSDIAYRLVIINSAHLMNEAAQNALLKNLEEPPSGVIFVLITQYPERLRETIRSRCWTINFDPLKNEELVTILIDYFSIDQQTAEAAAPFSNGSVTDALKLIELNIDNLREKTVSILRYSFGKKYHSAFDELNSLITNQDPDHIQIVIKMLLTWLNDLQKHKYNIHNYFFKQQNETLEKFNSKFPDIELKDIVFKLDRLSSYLKNNVNINLLIANIIFELSALPFSTNK